MAASDIDICVGGSVKFLCGGPGNGWLSIRPDLAETLRPSAVGWISHARPFDFEWGEIDYAPGIGRFAGGTPERAGRVRRGPRVTRRSSTSGSSGSASGRRR